jgi:DNA polymerase III alpha subunit (gram-positive type)
MKCGNMGSVSGSCMFCSEIVYINFSSDPISGNGIELGNKLVCNECRNKLKTKGGKNG